MSASNKPFQQHVMLNPNPLCYLLLLFILSGIKVQAQKNVPSSPPFTVRLMNIEAAANTTFTYNAKLRNSAPVSRIYQLFANVPPGWNVSFKVEGVQVTSLNMDSGKIQDINIDINPAMEVKPGKYNIPVLAVTGADSSRLNLEAVVKGAYGLTLTTPSGRLSDDITEGRSREIHLLVKNTGTLSLDNVDLSAQAPPQWEATFTPSTITRLEPGTDKEVVATLRVPDKTIAGDYVTTFTARNTNTSSNAAFRMTVQTSILTGWLGIAVILLALGAVYYLIRKYGRR